MLNLKTEKELLKWYDLKYCLEQVKHDGLLLQFVKNQTEEMCLEAVKRYGPSLQFV